jgi:hypothetical protein
MSILEQLGLIQKPEKHSLDKLNRMQVFADISSLFDPKLWAEKDEVKIQGLAYQILTTLNKYQKEADNLLRFRFGNFVVQIDPINIDHVITDHNQKEKIHIRIIERHGEQRVIVIKNRVGNE